MVYTTMYSIYFIYFVIKFQNMQLIMGIIIITSTLSG